MSYNTISRGPRTNFDKEMQAFFCGKCGDNEPHHHHKHHHNKHHNLGQTSFACSPNGCVEVNRSPGMSDYGMSYSTRAACQQACSLSPIKPVVHFGTCNPSTHPTKNSCGVGFKCDVPKGAPMGSPGYCVRNSLHLKSCSRGKDCDPGSNCIVPKGAPKGSPGYCAPSGHHNLGQTSFACSPGIGCHELQQPPGRDKFGTRYSNMSDCQKSCSKTPSHHAHVTPHNHGSGHHGSGHHGGSSVHHGSTRYYGSSGV